MQGLFESHASLYQGARSATYGAMCEITCSTSSRGSVAMGCIGSQAVSSLHTLQALAGDRSGELKESFTTFPDPLDAP
eukprot:scaffold3_cov389-Prasinococcus_capsulatus_cf.AAC.11